MSNNNIGSRQISRRPGAIQSALAAVSSSSKKACVGLRLRLLPPDSTGVSTVQKAKRPLARRFGGESAGKSSTLIWTNELRGQGCTALGQYAFRGPTNHLQLDDSRRLPNAAFAQTTAVSRLSLAPDPAPRGHQRGHRPRTRACLKHGTSLPREASRRNTTNMTTHFNSQVNSQRLPHRDAESNGTHIRRPDLVDETLCRFHWRKFAQIGAGLGTVQYGGDPRPRLASAPASNPRRDFRCDIIAPSTDGSLSSPT
ncbi:hypothetical protein K456DRAFT_32379 [Colletotrichum gloeosporioides 23]|nr:hypothetical protein K456DRAFT_32379 [Colletotrichum gloeosporioides 23]